VTDVQPTDIRMVAPIPGVGPHRSEPIDPTEPYVPRKKRMGILFWICVAWLALNIILAILANVLPFPNPNYENFNLINAGPGWGHLLGTDDLGRDILSRLVYGARISLVIGFGAIAIGLLLGGTAGLIAGYLRGTLETILNAVALVGLAFPALIGIIAITAFWGESEWKITLIIGVLSAPLLFRVIFASTISFSTREFITAARGLGATTWRIVFKELLPNVLPAIVSFSLIGVATVIILEGSLAFLGLSVPPPAPSWGNMIAEGREYLSQNLWLTLFPCLAIFSFLLALNYVGDRLRQRFDVSEGRL
jgi:peptide/nickel transport system permease protein